MSKTYSLVTFILSLLLGFQVYGKDFAKVKLAGEKEALLCEIDEAGAGYICPKEGQSVLVYLTPTPYGMGGGFQSYSALGFHPKKKELLKKYTVKEVKEFRGENETLRFSISNSFGGAGIAGYGGFSSTATNSFSAEQFENIKFSQETLAMMKEMNELGFAPPVDAEDSLKNIYTDYSLNSLFAAETEVPVNTLKGSGGIYGGQATYPRDFRIKGSEKFEKILALMGENFKTKQQEMLKSIDQGDFVLELENGLKLPCLKGEDSRLLTKEFKEKSRKAGGIASCELMKCGPLKRDGKNYTVALISPYVAGLEGYLSPMAVLVDENKSMKELLNVVSLTAANSDTPFFQLNPDLIEYRKKIESSKYLKKNVAPRSSSDLERISSVFTQPMGKMTFNGMKSRCSADGEVAKFFDESLLNFRKDMAQREVAQYIELSDWGLSSRWGTIENTQSEYCLENGVYLNKKAKSEETKLKALSENPQPQAISLEKANELFKKAQGMSDIAWGYKADGCYARAHLMARRFEAEGVDVGKVWIKGELTVPQTDIQWNFHVAPTVYVKNEKGDVERMVIDPSLATKPLTVREWSALMQKGVMGPDVVTSFPFPSNASSYERTAIAYSSSNPYLAESPLNMSEEEKMKEANTTMKNYKRFEK